MVPSSFTRKFLILLAFVVCVAYLAYRVYWTFNDTGPYAMTASVLLYAAEAFGILNLFLFFLQVWEVKEPPVQPVLEGRTVDVFVPTFNEDPALLRATLEACVRIDYPHKTYVLDDGQRPEVAALARELGVNYISRPDNRHFKAGNLNHAFERTDGEFVVVLDADHVPEPHFITRLIGYFRDDRLGYVQTPHAFYNFDSFQARLDHASRKYWEEGHVFYYVIQPGRNHWGCPIFAGSAAMFRRSAIRDVGLMATETITEDMHTGLRMNARGWRSLAISERLVAGQAAPDITTFHAQRLRWGTGNLSIMKYDNPITVRGLSLPQRLCYLGSMMHWASGPFKLIIYLTPIAMLFSGIPPVREFSVELLAVTLAYLIISLATLKIVSNGYGSIINSELFSMVNFWTQIKSTFRALFGLGSRHFHVTPKGAAAVVQRQKKSVWPFIRPQTYLILLSVLALFWGWSRPALGISDDLFKPVVPTVWVLLHFWLAYKVTQRAFWPADRRFTARHVVHVPVEYDTLAGSTTLRYGVTVDLNDTGMAFVAYERFSPGDVLRFTIRGAGEVVKCKGELRTVTDLTRGQVADGFRYGVQFQNLTPPQVDALNRICLHYGVPRMYGEFDQKRGGLLGGIQKRLDRGMTQRRGETRNQYRLPIVVNSGVTEDTAQFSATEDLSRSAVAALLDHELPKNTAVGYLMASPLGEVRGSARVTRTIPAVYGGRTYFRTVMEFNDFEGQGRTTLHSLVNPQEAGPLRDALKPDRKPILVQMAGATLVAVLIAIPLILLQSGLFRYFHKDDYVLRDISAKYPKGTPGSPEDGAEVQRIFDVTMHDKNPTGDRLVLLMNALTVYDRRYDQLTIAERLAGFNRHDLSLQQSLIYAQIRAERFANAEQTYEDLLALRDKEPRAFKNYFDEEKLKMLLLSGARVAEGRGDLPLALERYKALYDQWPDYVPPDEPGNTSIRREYAGVLFKAGSNDPSKYDEAKRVLQGDKPTDVESKRMLAAAYLLKGRSIASDSRLPEQKRQDDEAREYDGAEEVANALTAEAERKGDTKTKEMAERMKADVQMARKAWKQASEIVAKLIATSGGDVNKADPDVLRRLAQVQLGLGDYPGALNGFAMLLENNRVSGSLKTDVMKGFIDAAAHQTVTLGERERAVALDIKNTPVIDNDAIYLARLGWVLQRLKQPIESQAVLERARQKAPGNPQIREQLANILIESDNMERAAEVLAEINPFRGRETLAGVHMKHGRLAEAAAELTKAKTDYPTGYRNPDGSVVSADDSRRIDMMLGNVLGLQALKNRGDREQAFRTAITHYQSLDKKYPNDKEIETAIGNLYLWSAERAVTPAERDEAYTAALKQFQLVLTSKTANWTTDAKGMAVRAKVEQGFIDAASSAPVLDSAQSAIARDIATRRLGGPVPEPVTAARLAWVLVKTNDPEARKEGLDLLRKAVAGATTDNEKRELGGVFAGAKDFKSAADLLAPIAKTPADIVKVAELYAGARQWDQAKAELNKVMANTDASAEEKKAARRELAKITAWSGDHAEALGQIGEILKQDPNDVDMRALQAEVSVWSKNLDQALAQYLPLIKQYPDDAKVATGFANAAAKSRNPLSEEAKGILLRLTDKAVAPENKDPLLLARVAEAHATKLNDPDRAKLLALKAAQMDPREPIVRREVAYALANPEIRLFKEADALFIGMDLAGEDRKQYVFIASQAENYEAARKQARLYLAEQPPGTLKEREARRLLADVLTWKGDYEEALAIYEKLAEALPKDRDLKIDIAQAYRYWQNYPTALTKFAELLGEDVENSKLWVGFIDAASSAPKIDHQKDLLLRIYDKYASSIQDPRAMSRLAWVMIRLNEPARAHPLLTRAVAANPQQPAVRKELAGVLAAADRRVEAINMLTVPDVLAGLDVTELLNLADLLTAENQLERAERELAKVITDTSDRKSRVRYASVLLWNGKYVPAQEILTKLARDFPNDREIVLLQAQSYLWSKDYTNALKRFTDIVAVNPDPATKSDPLADPDNWRGYIDAAAGAVGESLREFPRKNIGPLFTSPQREAIVRAYQFLVPVREKTLLLNRIDEDNLVAGRSDRDPTFDARRKSVLAKNDVRLKGLAGSMGRLGLLLGLLGDRDKSSTSFGAALAIDRNNRDVWLQYAQTLTALGDDLKAKAVFDWLIANPAQKGPAPLEPK